MRVFVSAAEASSDAYGAHLISSLKKKAQDASDSEISFYGIGGTRMQGAGASLLYDSSRLLAMGFSELLGRLRNIFQAYLAVRRSLAQERPDVAVFLDYPDFHFFLAPLFRKRGIPTVYYIPPKIWAWRSYRIRKLKKFFTRVLCIFPFEENYYSERNLAAVYVGNPLLDGLPLTMTKEEARRKLELNADEIVLTLLPGSRPAEIRLHLERMLQATQLFRHYYPDRKTNILIPLSLSSGSELIRRTKETIEQRRLSNVRVSIGDSAICLRAADAAIVKSGTSTLEAALMGCPHVVVYDGSRLTRFIFTYLIRYKKAVALSNLVNDFSARSPFVFREFLGKDFVPRNVSVELQLLLQNPLRKKEIQIALENIKTKLLQCSDSPSDHAAEEVLNTSRMMIEPLSSVFIGIGSWFWSLATAIKRLAVRVGLMKTEILPVRVIGIGNLQAGGAGKTPLVIRAAREALVRGQRVCILIRGYGGQWESEGGIVRPGAAPVPARFCGDEAALIQEKVPEAWIGVGKNRKATFDQIFKEAEGQIDVAILDDAFQQAELKQDVRVLAVTSTGPRQRLYRDFPFFGRDADVIVWTKGEKPPAWRFVKTASSDEKRAVIRARFELPPERTKRRIWLICGVGDSSHALRTAQEAGYSIARFRALKDHHRFTQKEILNWKAEAHLADVQIAVTGKDFVKWKEYLNSSDEVIVLEPEVLFLESENQWQEKLWGPSL